jgi:hypothetical protein
MPYVDDVDSDLDSDEEEDYENESPITSNSSNSSSNRAPIPVASISAWRNSGIKAPPAAVIVRETGAGEIKELQDIHSLPKFLGTPGPQGVHADGVVNAAEDEEDEDVASPYDFLSAYAFLYVFLIFFLFLSEYIY